MNVSLDYENKIIGLFPRIVFSDKGEYVESDTKVYDEMAFKWVGLLVYLAF